MKEVPARMLYLASPYTHDDPDVRKARFEQATAAAAGLVRLGHIVFSPLTMTHPIDIILAGNGSTLGSNYWLAFDRAFMDRCDELVILDVDGWRSSRGVLSEISYFAEMRKPIWMLVAGSRLTRVETLADIGLSSLAKQGSEPGTTEATA